MTKRLLDVFVTLLLMPLALPLMAAIALWVRLDSPGPALFRQPRVGRGGRLFRITRASVRFVQNVVSHS